MVVLVGYIFLFLMFWLMRQDKKFRNPYKLRMYFGKKGCGKTTHICKTSLKYLKKGIPVYTTEYIPGTYHIGYEDIGRVQFPRGSVIMIDEVGMIWDNREFKSFSKDVRNYFKLQRHYGQTVYLYSQCFDIDKKLRDLCDELYIMKSYFNCFSVCKRIRKDLTIVEAHGEAESRITDDLKVVPFIVPGSRRFTYLPKYHKYFDSFAAPELPTKMYDLQPVKCSEWHLRVQIALAFVELRCSFKRTVRRIQTKVLTLCYKKGWICLLKPCVARRAEGAQRAK